MTDKVKDNRYDYQYETDLVLENATRLAVEYRQKGLIPYLIFMGDIFNSSYKSPMISMLHQGKITKLRNYFEDIFSVIGNHELNFPKNNPFWALTSVNAMNMSNPPYIKFKPLGDIGIIKLVDRIVDGNVVINFNHYSSSILKPIEGKTNIGLFHQDIECTPAIQSATQRGLAPYQGNSIMLDTRDVLVGYDYSFFGHFHKYYGIWEIDGGRYIYYLGSTGRPAQDEVNDNFLERNLPALVVEDGVFKGVENNYITLPNRISSVKEIIVETQQNNRIKLKEKKEILNSIHFKTSVVESVKSTFDNPAYHSIIDSIIEGKRDEFYEYIFGGSV